MKIAIALFLAATILLTGCYGQTVPPATSNSTGTITGASVASVEISGFAFTPATLTIAKGTTVTWTQKDAAPHAVTGGTFDSGTLNAGQTYSHTFNEIGSFNYHCNFHQSMTGKITVQ